MTESKPAIRGAPIAKPTGTPGQKSLAEAAEDGYIVAVRLTCPLFQCVEHEGTNGHFVETVLLLDHCIIEDEKSRWPGQ